MNDSLHNEAPQDDTQGSSSPHTFNAMQNNEKLLAQLVRKNQQRNMRRKQEYEIQKMLDFEAEERRNKAQLQFEMQLEKTRSFKDEQRLLKARNIKDPIQRAKLLIGDVSFKKPVAVLAAIPAERKT